MTNDRDNKEVPRNGDLVKFYNGLIGEVISIKGTGWRAKVEAVVNGTRVYRRVCDISVIGILDRIVNTINRADEAENG